MNSLPPPAEPGAEPYTTIDAAQLLGLAVRSVQLMVDRGELDAWKTPGGHRRISRVSVERWLVRAICTAAPSRSWRVVQNTQSWK